MKYFKNIYLLLIIVMVGVSIPEKVTAQRRKTRVVKRTTIKRGVVQKRPVRVRRVAHIRYRHLPRWGKSVRRIGKGNRLVSFRGVGFRFYNGVWYRPRGKRFIVTRPPFGIRIRTLPIAHRRIIIGSRIYFYYYGSFYAKIDDSNEYEVIEPPIGAEIDALPEGYKVIEVNGQEYYKLENTYYEALIDENEEEYYVVVEDPTK